MKEMLYVGKVRLRTFMLLALWSAPAVVSAAEVAGEVVSVQGSVFIRPDGRQTATKLAPARAGDPVYAGDVVNTPSDGKIKILMKDKSIMDLGPSALFKVDHFTANGGTDREADVSMMYGTMRAAITQKITGKGRFRVRTPAATMGVRGTEFVVKSEVRNMDEVRKNIAAPTMGRPANAPEAAKTEITVIQGQVDVKKEAEKPVPGRAPAAEPKVISLTAGAQLTTKQGDVAPPKLVQLDTKQLASITNEVKVLDNTFQKAVVIDLNPGSATGNPGSSGSDPSMGHATVEAIAAAAVSPAVVAPPVSMADVGLAGTFNVATQLTQGPVVQQPTNKLIKITVVRK